LFQPSNFETKIRDILMQKRRRIRLRRCLALLLLCAMMMPFVFSMSVPVEAISNEWDGSAATAYAGGTGTSTDPYLISTAEQLAYFSSRVNGGHDNGSGVYVKLTQDILLNAMTASSSSTFLDTFVETPDSATKYQFTPIGISNHQFLGNFDGNGMKVIGLYINQPTFDNQGLFGITNSGSFTAMNVSVYGVVTGQNNVGAIIGSVTNGTIVRCSNYCTVTGTNNVGGISGFAGLKSSIRNCLNVGSVQGTDGVGGISGKVDKNNEEMGNNLSIGTVTGTTNVGGVAGSFANSPNVWNNYTTVSPAVGSLGGDYPSSEGGLFIGTAPTETEWAVIINDLNGVTPGTSQNLDGNDIWTPVTGGIPVIGIFLPNGKVAGGKYYTYLDVPDTSTVTVTADSAFTVAYKVSYSASGGTELSTQTVGLKQGATVVTLPAQTTVIMLVDGVYYYKNLTADLTGSIMLNQFIQMGTTATNYPSQSAAAGSTKQYLFIFDFSRTTAGIAAGTSNIEFLIAGGTTTGTVPTVTVAGQNAYSLTAASGTDSCTAALSKTTAMGYDYKTDGKSYFYEIYLQQSGSTVNLPIGTKVNGTVITGSYPSAFVPANVLSGTTISIDMSGCAVPLTAGTYTVQVKAYASSYSANPRNDTLLAAGSADITLTAIQIYGIRAVAGTRFFDASAAAQSVPLTIQTLGTGNVQSTLQQKYGISYANVSGQVNQPVSISGGAANLTLPAGSAKGTYRFVLTKYNSTGTAQAESIQNVIIK